MDDTKYKPDFATLRIAAEAAKERGVPVDQLLDELQAKMERIDELRKSRSGKYRVVGVDKFNGEDWMHGEYDSAEEALAEARKMTRESMEYASDSSVATVYYAYDPNGRYLGDDA